MAIDSSVKKVTLRQINADEYNNNDGYIMKREYIGTSDGRWVYRDPSNEYIDADRYRSDLAERNFIILT